VNELPLKAVPPVRHGATRVNLDLSSLAGGTCAWLVEWEVEVLRSDFVSANASADAEKAGSWQKARVDCDTDTQAEHGECTTPLPSDCADGCRFRARPRNVDGWDGSYSMPSDIYKPQEKPSWLAELLGRLLRMPAWLSRLIEQAENVPTPVVMALTANATLVLLIALGLFGGVLLASRRNSIDWRSRGTPIPIRSSGEGETPHRRCQPRAEKRPSHAEKDESLVPLSKCPIGEVSAATAGSTAEVDVVVEVMVDKSQSVFPSSALSQLSDSLSAAAEEAGSLRRAEPLVRDAAGGDWTSQMRSGVEDASCHKSLRATKLPARCTQQPVWTRAALPNASASGRGARPAAFRWESESEAGSMSETSTQVERLEELLKMHVGSRCLDHGTTASASVVPIFPAVHGRGRSCSCLSPEEQEEVEGSEVTISETSYSSELTVNENMTLHTRQVATTTPAIAGLFAWECDSEVDGSLNLERAMLDQIETLTHEGNKGDVLYLLNK